MMQEGRHSRARRSDATRGETLRRLATYSVVFVAGFVAALWIATPPQSEAQGGELGEIAGIEFGRDGLYIEPRSKDSLLIVETRVDGVPRSHPIPPGERPTKIPGEEVEGGWGLYEIRFRPCRVGDCTDPVPPPDLFDQSGLVMWAPGDVREMLCRTCDSQKCCPKDE